MNDNQLIEALGGCNAVARLLGITGPSVSGWKAIPTDRKILYRDWETDRKSVV